MHGPNVDVPIVSELIPETFGSTLTSTCCTTINEVFVLEFDMIIAMDIIFKENEPCIKARKKGKNEKNEKEGSKRFNKKTITRDFIK